MYKRQQHEIETIFIVQINKCCNLKIYPYLSPITSEVIPLPSPALDRCHASHDVPMEGTTQLADEVRFRHLLTVHHLPLPTLVTPVTLDHLLEGRRPAGSQASLVIR